MLEKRNGTLGVEDRMKIILASAPMFNNTSKNIETIRSYVSENKDADLIVFGEAFLQGFDGLSWEYEKDKDIAVTIKSEDINVMRDLARENNIAISFGFYEKVMDGIYSSNIFIDKNGQILDVYRRVSGSWTVENASESYRSGDNFKSFYFMDKSMVVAICGDLWFDENIERINCLNADLILWPLYIDYSIEEWSGGALEEYRQQVKTLNAPVLLINSYMKGTKGAVGGAYLFDKGEIIDFLSLGEIGILALNY